MTQTEIEQVQGPDPEPGPVVAIGAQPDPIKHTHACPVCFEQVACKEYCATEVIGEELFGAPSQCDDCKNASPESVDIVTGKIAVGDVLRCDVDALVYEVTSIDIPAESAYLETVIGYPKSRRTMRLARDGSPARRSFVEDNGREPLWFRVVR